MDQPNLAEGRQDALNEAWRIVDAEGGAGAHPEYTRALTNACASIERVGGRDPDPDIAALRAKAAALEDALTRIAGGSFPGASTLAIAGDWHGFIDSLQDIARAALAKSQGAA